MDDVLYWLARGVLFLLCRLPLRWVARLGRFGGALAFLLDRRHRRVALKNFQLCLGQEYSPNQVLALVKENFRRIGENFACAARSAHMTEEQLRPHAGWTDPHGVLPKRPGERMVFAIGHFGNFEIYARFSEAIPGYQTATTYRGLRQATLNQLLQDLRNRSGCRFFERRTEAAALKAFMNQPSVVLGLLSDQHAGDSGLRLPFLGRECSTSTAPAVLALRYGCTLSTAICYRVGLAQWRVEAGATIPTHVDGKPRPIADIMLEVNQTFEAAVRRDPANWFWVHNRWKARPALRQPSPRPPAP